MIWLDWKSEIQKTNNIQTTLGDRSQKSDRNKEFKKLVNKKLDLGKPFLGDILLYHCYAHIQIGELPILK
jgi:hypothetical protein